MLNFIMLTLNDIQKIKPYFLYSTNKTCDNTVGGTFMWRDYFSVEYAEWNNNLVFKVKVQYHNDITAFTLPLGADRIGCIEEIEKYCRAEGIPVVFCTMTKDDISFLNTRFNNYQLFHEKDWSDYIYSASDIVTLTGRKYNGQRNHINYFKKAYDKYSFEIITEKNIDEVREFYRSLGAIIKNSDLFIEERTKTFEVLDNYETYGLIGGVLKIDNSIVAFSIGEKCRNVLFIHIEKADLRYRGAYQMINNEFAKYYVSSEIEYVNREEDVGDEGLRRSKESYHPFDIIDKYIVEVK